MKHLFFSFLAGIAMLLASCSEYDLGYTPEQIGYNISFRRDFGDYDMANDFNLAQRGQVTVTPTTCSEVCIYSKAATGWQLVAKYDDVTGTRSLGFDVPKGTKDILVANGSQTQKTTVGSSVSFSGTRAGQFDKDDSTIKIELNEGSRYTYYYYDADEALSFSNMLPERKFNKDKAIDDFTLVSTGEFIIYPTYWNAGFITAVGIYYYDESGNIVKNVVFGNHALNESIQCLSEDGDWETIGWNDNYEGNDFYIVDEKQDMLKNRNNRPFRSKGIIVNLPVGTRFGFYTPMGGNYHNHYCPRNCFSTVEGYERVGNRFGNWWHDGVKATYASGWMDAHSESHLNPPDIWTEAWTAETYMNNTRHAVMFGLYFDNKSDIVVGAEDTYGDGFAGWASDYDLNDRIFKIYGSQPEVLNNKSQSWILPFEDLGGSFDWDFNDVILKMDYVSGQKTAKITPIAAGGTLHSEVFFNDTDDESKTQDLGEIHVLLGADPVSDDELYEPINASHRGTPGTAKTVNITDPATFSCIL